MTNWPCAATPAGPETPAHEHDNRWMRLPLMDWAAAARRHDRESIEGRVFAVIRGLARRQLKRPPPFSQAKGCN